MSKSSTKVMYFNEGAARDGEEFLLAGLLYENQDNDEELTSIVHYEPVDGWSYIEDLDYIVNCLLTYRDGVGFRTMAIGRTGEVAIMYRGKTEESEIPIDAGFLFHAVYVDGEVFACGSNKQVWRWDGKSWSRAGTGAGVNAQAGVDQALYGVSATSLDNAVAVGTKGNIVRFDGTSWFAIDSPTNVSLERVVHLSADEIMFVGNQGQAYRGSETGGWISLELPGMDEDFWGLCMFKGDAYCCTSSAIYRLTPGGLAPVKMGRTRPKDYYRLFANDQFMWLTTGTDEVFRFDGKQWKELVCPENT